MDGHQNRRAGAEGDQEARRVVVIGVQLDFHHGHLQRREEEGFKVGKTVLHQDTQTVCLTKVAD